MAILTTEEAKEARFTVLIEKTSSVTYYEHTHGSF